METLSKCSWLLTVIASCFVCYWLMFKLHFCASIAEEKFLQCLKHFEVVAPNNYGIVVILQNLGKLYTQKKRWLLNHADARLIVLHGHLFPCSKPVCLALPLTLSIFELIDVLKS